MPLPNINTNNIHNFFDSEDVIIDTIQQIKKDFGMFGVDITFSGDIKNAFLELHSQISNQIEVLSNNNTSKLYSLLYQIDISDKKIIDLQNQLPNYSLIDIISYQVIMRDLQKVLTRKYYKSKNKLNQIE